MLGAVDGIECIGLSGEARANDAYFPILVRPGYSISRDALYRMLGDNGVFARRYFHPLISSFPMYSQLASSRKENRPVATEAASQVICLPIYPALRDDQVERIVGLIAWQASGHDATAHFSAHRFPGEQTTYSMTGI